MSPVLVINTGSSTIKYQLLEVGDRGRRGARVRVLDRIGRMLVQRAAGQDPPVVEEPVADHEAGFGEVLATFEQTGVPGDLAAVGHQVVHGGVRFDGTVLVDDAVLIAIRELSPLAPLHNPANALGIEVGRRLDPQLPQVAVFDTALHRTMPPQAYRYAFPGSWPTGTASAGSGSRAPPTSTCPGARRSISDARSGSST